jgi:Flp pilus assembly protein TadG
MRTLNRDPRSEDGAAAVEFALISGVLAMLIFGMLQFGLAFFEIQNIRAATREGARIGAVGAEDDEVYAKVSDASYGSVPASGDVISLDETCPDDPEPDDATSYTVSVDLGDPDLPARLKNIMSVDIPFLPTMELTPTVSGEFRCEGQ